MSPPIATRARIVAVLAGLLAIAGLPGGASAVSVLTKEPATMQLGERVLIDDGSCPAGQMREVVAVGNKTASPPRIERMRQCVSRKR